MKTLLFSLFIIVLSPSARALELLQIDQKSDGFDLTFNHEGYRVVAQDKTGWMTLNTLTYLLFQKSIEESYVKPKKVKSILRSSPPHLKLLNASLVSVLRYIATSERDPAVKTNIQEILDGKLLTPGAGFVTNETLLNRTLGPLLENRLKQQTVLVKYSKQGRHIASTKENLLSTNPAQPLGYYFSQRALKIPIKSAVRSRQFLQWQPSQLKIRLLK
jgi:hypothetical protein